MGNWGASDFRQATTQHHKDLQSVVNQFPSGLKQAMYAATNDGKIVARRTWDGCAFNAAGGQVNKEVSSTYAAAAAFDVPETLVSNFIDIWDSVLGSDEEATEFLRETILRAGLFSEPGAIEKMKRRVVSHKVYESEKSRFEALMLANEIANIDVAESILVPA